MEKHKRPENCPVTVPKVNQEIWGLIDHQRDLKVQRDQRQEIWRSKGTKDAWSRRLTLWQKSLMVWQNNLPHTTKWCWKTSLILKTSHELSVERTFKIVHSRQVNRKYQKLASNDVPITEYLFGDDLKGSLTAIDLTSRLGQLFGAQRTPGKFVGSFQSKNWGDQRGRGRGWSRGRMPTSRSGTGK